MEYTRKGDRYENLSPEEYLNVIRPYLNCLINEHKPTVELNDDGDDNDDDINKNNNNDNSNNSNNNNNNNNNNNDNSNNSNINNSNNNNNNNNNKNNRAEWKIQLPTQNSCISTRSFEDKRTLYPKIEPVETFMGSNTEDVIYKNFLIHFYEIFKVHKKHQMKQEAIVLNYYIIIFKE